MELHGDQPVFTPDEMAAIITEIDTGIKAAQNLAFSDQDEKNSAFYSGAEWSLWELRIRIEVIIGARLGVRAEWGEC